MRFYKQKRILHKYVRWMYDLLEDGRFYNLQRARKIKDLPRSYKHGDAPVRYFERMYHCADTFTGVMDPNTGEHRLERGFFCGDRVCPVCAIKKSLWEYSKLTWQMEHFQEEYTYYFLTLTLPNNPEGFRTEIDLIASVLTELSRYVGYDERNRGGRFKFCSGLYGSYEITKSHHGWHPHLHLVLAYPKKYVVSTATVRKNIKGRERVFENGLQLRCGKKQLLLSQDSIMQKYIELIRRKTDVYNERLEDLNFLNIGFQPCYNIEQGVNEMSKYLIDFEALENADDLYIYMHESYNLRQRVRRGIFRWTPELKQAHRSFLDDLHDKSNFYFIQSKKEREVHRYQYRWYYGYYVASRFIVSETGIPYTNKKKRIMVIERLKIKPLYDARGKPLKYHIEKLQDQVMYNWFSDLPQNDFEYKQIDMKECFK